MPLVVRIRENMLVDEFLGGLVDSTVFIDGWYVFYGEGSPIRRTPELSCSTGRLTIRVGEKGMNRTNIIMLIPSQRAVDKVCRDGERMRLGNPC